MPLQALIRWRAAQSNAQRHWTSGITTSDAPPIRRPTLKERFVEEADIDGLLRELRRTYRRGGGEKLSYLGARLQ